MKKLIFLFVLVCMTNACPHIYAQDFSGETSTLFTFRSYHYRICHWNPTQKHWIIPNSAEDGKMVIVVDLEKRIVRMLGENYRQCDIDQIEVDKQSQYHIVKMSMYTPEGLMFHLDVMKFLSGDKKVILLWADGSQMAYAYDVDELNY